MTDCLAVRQRLVDIKSALASLPCLEHEERAAALALVKEIEEYIVLREMFFDAKVRHSKKQRIN
jgi:hypothetical protein